MSVNFSDLASMPTADVKKPDLPPQGHYRWVITKLPTEKVTRSEEYLMIRFPCQAVEALDAGMMDGYEGEVKNIRLSKQFLIHRTDPVETEKGMYRLRTFLEEHVGASGKTMGELMNNAVNGQYVAPLVWGTNKDTGEATTEIGNTAPVV